MIRTRVGYTGGSTVDPTYRGMGDHTEALQIDFDPAVLRYEEILERVWSSHDPTRPAYSRQYMAAIWCHDDEQLDLARATGAAATEGSVLTTRIERVGPFYRAEDYHQKYRLRREEEIVLSLIRRFGSDRGMVDSTAAARINGWLRGYVPRDVDDLIGGLALSLAGERALRDALAA